MTSCTNRCSTETARAGRQGRGVVAWLGLAATLALLVAGVPRARAETVSTLYAIGPQVAAPAWDRTSVMDAWGVARVMYEATPTYGQTFVAPRATPFLESMAFVIQSPSWNPAIDFRAYVYEWTGTTIAGPALYESPLASVAAAPDAQVVLVAVPHLRLDPDRQYVAFYTTIGAGNAGTTVAKWGYMQAAAGDAAYGGGSFVFNNGLTFASLEGASTWRALGRDLAFTLSFSGDGGETEVPALSPPAVGMLAFVLLLAARSALRRARG